MKTKVEFLVPAKKRIPARPAKFMKLKKVTVEVCNPESFEQRLDDLIVFDARLIDKASRTQLQRLFPALVHQGHYWIARFAEKGCLCCHRKKVPYASGGLCGRCYQNERNGMLRWYSKRFSGRDVEKEVSALTLELDVAQRLLNDD